MATEFVTTNVRLPRDLYKELKLRAVEEHKSLGQVIREFLSLVLGKPSTIDSPTIPNQWRQDPFFQLVGKFEGPQDLSEGHDAFIYDEEG